MIYYSKPMVAVLFQRGAFTESDTHLVGEVQAIILLQVPPYVVGMLFVRLISALKANQVMMWGNAINLFVCVVLNYVLMQRFGVVGIAVGTSVMYFISVAFLVLVSLRLIREKAGERR
jgi:putative peptidoglycan lipid II flippase